MNITRKTGTELFHLLEKVNNANIVNVLTRYIHLQKDGITYKGVSPFVAEPNTCLVVHPHEQRWECTKTGLKGYSAVSFVMASKRMSYVEALNDLIENY